jgi:hypothetical protein
VEIPIMIAAAIYCRKSALQERDAESVAIQLANARNFAEARGWTVADEHVYSDDAKSEGLPPAGQTGSR